MTTPQPMREAFVVNVTWRHGAPNMGPVTWTKVSSTFLRHISITVWPWSCEAGCHSRKSLWSWATTARVSCTADQKVSLWMQLPSDPTVSGTVSQWSTVLRSLSWLLWGSTRSDQETDVPVSYTNPTLCLDKWSSIVDKAHFYLRYS